VKKEFWKPCKSSTSIWKWWICNI